MSRSRKLKRGIEREFYWGTIKFLKWFMNVLPHKMAVNLGGWLGVVGWAASKRRVDKAEARCVRALGIGPTLARSVVRNSYKNIGRSAAEFLRLPKLLPSIDSYVRMHNEERMHEALSKGRGAILVLAHQGNWELANVSLSKRFPMHVIGADQRDARITELLREFRDIAGSVNVPKGQGLRGALQCLKQGDVLAVLLDQDARDKGVVVPFLGLPASTPRGIISLVNKFGAAVIPMAIIRSEDGYTFDLYLGEEFQSAGGKPFGEDESASLELCNDWISHWIERYPDQWMWLYPRWESTLGDM